MNYLLSLLFCGLIAQSQTVYKNGYICSDTDTVSVQYYMDSVSHLDLDKQIRAKKALNQMLKPKK